MNEDLNHYIKQCVKNDVSAQLKIYQLFSPVLYGICLKYMKNENDAKDVFQEAFVIAFQKIEQFKFEVSFEGWLKRIFINKCIEALKKNQKEPYFLDIITLDFQDEIDLERTIIPEEKLLELIHALPDQYRMVFNLTVFEKMKHKEIAEKLNISEGTSKSNLNRAKEILKKKISAIINYKTA